MSLSRATAMMCLAHTGRPRMQEAAERAPKSLLLLIDMQGTCHWGGGKFDLHLAPGTVWRAACKRYV